MVRRPTHSADADAVSTCDLWHPGQGKESVKVSNAGALTALSAEGEDGPLLGARQSDEEGRDPFRIARAVTPPHLIVEPNEKNGAVFKALALVDGHQRHLVHAREPI